MATFPVEFFDMAAPRFVHLRLHSEYSVSDGVVRIDDAVERARDDGMPALALTDAANVFGMVKFYRRGARRRGQADHRCRLPGCRTRPIATSPSASSCCAPRAPATSACATCCRAPGCATSIAAGPSSRASGCEDTEGLIALSGAAGGDVGQALLGDHAEAAERLRAGLGARLSPAATTSSCSAPAIRNAEALVARTVALASRLGLPVVATHPVQFLDAGDFQAHEARVCIATGHMLGDQRRPKRFTPEQYFKRQDEMAKLFADIPHALANSIEIARRCNLAIELGKSRLPAFPTPDGRDDRRAT